MTAKQYYKSSTEGLPYTYTLLGKDGAGRRLYERSLGGLDCGRVSLLSFAEYKQDKKRVARDLSSSVQVSRWTRTTLADGTLAPLLA